MHLFPSKLRLTQTYSIAAYFGDKRGKIQKQSPNVLWKKVFRKIWQNSQENTCYEVIFVKLFSNVYWKEDSMADAALWIFLNVWIELLYIEHVNK